MALPVPDLFRAIVRRRAAEPTLRRTAAESDATSRSGPGLRHPATAAARNSARALERARQWRARAKRWQNSQAGFDRAKNAFLLLKGRWGSIRSLRPVVRLKNQRSDNLVVAEPKSSRHQQPYSVKAHTGKMKKATQNFATGNPLETLDFLKRASRGRRTGRKLRTVFHAFGCIWPNGGPGKFPHSLYPDIQPIFGRITDQARGHLLLSSNIDQRDRDAVVHSSLRMDRRLRQHDFQDCSHHTPATNYRHGCRTATARLALSRVPAVTCQAAIDRNAPAFSRRYPVYGRISRRNPGQITLKKLDVNHFCTVLTIS